MKEEGEECHARARLRRAVSAKAGAARSGSGPRGSCRKPPPVAKKERKGLPPPKVLTQLKTGAEHAPAA